MRFDSYCATLHAVAARGLDMVAGETKGFLLAVCALEDGGAALTVMGEGERERLFEAWRALGQLAEDARNRLLDSWRAELASGLPNGIERLHPSWIEAALAGEPPYLVELLRDCLATRLCPAVDEPLQAVALQGDAANRRVLQHDLARVAFSHLAPLCEGERGSEGGPLADRLCALTLDELTDEVARAGARTLARSLAGSDAAVRARAMALTGEPWATIMAQAFAQPASDDERKAAVAHVAATVAVAAHTPRERLLHVGLATLAPDLAAESRVSRGRVAGRLPAELGRRLLEW